MVDRVRRRYRFLTIGVKNTGGDFNGCLLVSSSHKEVRLWVGGSFDKQRLIKDDVNQFSNWTGSVRLG